MNTLCRAAVIERPESPVVVQEFPVPELEPGEYTLCLQVELRGRTTMVSERTLDVR